MPRQLLSPTTPELVMQLLQDGSLSYQEIRAGLSGFGRNSSNTAATLSQMCSRGQIIRGDDGRCFIPDEESHGNGRMAAIAKAMQGWRVQA